MKLKELLLTIGVPVTYTKGQWDNVSNKYIYYEMEGVNSVHSHDKRMINNHLEDELPYYIRLGPIAIFAIQIPTADKYAFFSANSIGMSDYMICRYSDYNKNKFENLKAQLSQEHAYSNHESEQFQIFAVLTAIDKGGST